MNEEKLFDFLDNYAERINQELAVLRAKLSNSHSPEEAFRLTKAAQDCVTDLLHDADKLFRSKRVTNKEK